MLGSDCSALHRVNPTKITVALHNFWMSLNSNNNYTYSPPGFADQKSLLSMNGKMEKRQGKYTEVKGLNESVQTIFQKILETRNSFKEFNEEGQVEGQWNIV